MKYYFDFGFADKQHMWYNGEHKQERYRDGKQAFARYIQIQRNGKNAEKDLMSYAQTMSMANYNVMNHKLWNFILCLWNCRKIWNQIRPDYIISTGAAFALPMFIIGKLYGSKLIYIESRAKVYTPTKTLASAKSL